MQPIRTHDGSPTFWSPEFKEHYHSPVGARLEAQWKYVVPSRLGARLAAGPVRLLDVCFGLGYNTLAACARATRQRAHRLEVIALEINRPMVAHAAACATETRPFAWRAALSDLFAKGRLDRKHFRIGMRWGDARDTLRRLRPRTVDIVFLDPFSTQRNSELWTVDCFRMLKAVMAPGGVLLTYSTAVPVLAGLLEAGFHVGQTRPGHGLRNGTLAALRADDIDTPLAPEQLAAIRTTPRGTPYRDPYGCWTNRAILRDREERMALANDTRHAREDGDNIQ